MADQKTTVRELITVLKLVNETSAGLRDMRKSERQVKKHQETLTKIVRKESKKRERDARGRFVSGKKTVSPLKTSSGFQPWPRWEQMKAKSARATRLHRAKQAANRNQERAFRAHQRRNYGAGLRLRDTLEMRRVPLKLRETLEMRRPGLPPGIGRISKKTIKMPAIHSGRRQGPMRQAPWKNAATGVSTLPFMGAQGGTGQFGPFGGPTELPTLRRVLLKTRTLELAASKLTWKEKTRLTRKGLNARWRYFKLQIKREAFLARAAGGGGGFGGGGFGGGRRGRRGRRGGFLGRLGLGAAVGAGAALALPAIGGIVGGRIIQRTADAADIAKVRSDQAGTSSQKIQELEFISDIVGTKFPEVITALRRASDNAIDAIKGKGQGVEQFGALGLLGDIANNKYKDSMDLLEAIMKAREQGNFSKLELQWLDTVFGRSGSKNMGPMLSIGSKAFAALREEAQAYGLVVSEDLTDASQKWNDEIVRMRGIAKGLRNDIAEDLLPVFTTMLEAFRFWFLANRKLIKQGLSGYIENLSKAFGVFLKLADRLDRVIVQMGGWGEVTGALASAFTLLAGALVLGGVHFAVVKLATFLAGKTVYAAIAGTLAWGKAVLGFGVAANVAFAPIYALLGLLAAIAAIFEDLMTEVQGGESVLGNYLIVGTGDNVIEEGIKSSLTGGNSGGQFFGGMNQGANPALAASLKSMGGSPAPVSSVNNTSSSSSSSTTINNPQNIKNMTATVGAANLYRNTANN